MRRLIRLILLGLLAGPAAAAEDDLEEREIVSGDRSRSYLIELVGEAEAPRPALIVLHGRGGRPDRIRRHAGFTLADEGWAMIYPEGVDKSWNDGRTGIDSMPIRETEDVAFIRDLIAELAGEGVVNPTRVFFAGISNGGMMTLRILCDAPELAAGAAIVAATHPVGLYCTRQTPVPLLFFHGTEDRFFPYHGDRAPARFRLDGGQASTVPHVMELAALRNQCQGYRDFPIRDNDPEDETQLRMRVYDGCRAPLVHYIVEGGGHTWPGSEPRRKLEELLGPTSREVDATEEIERLFLSLAGD